MSTQEVSFSQLLQGLALDDLAVFCPVPLVIHPAGGPAIDAHGVRWSIDQGLCAPGSGAARSNIGLLLSAGFPHATEGAARAITCYSYWALLWNDHLESKAHDLETLTIHVAEANRVLQEPDAAPVPDDRWLASLRDARRMLERSLTLDGIGIMRAEHLAWVSGELWKAALLQRAAPPSVGEYLRMRFYKAGMRVLAALTAPAGGYRMSAEEYHDPLVQAFTCAVYYPCALFNDLVSLAKEAPLGQARVNIAFAIAREHGVAPAQALVKVWELHERLVCLMLRLQQRLLDDPRPAVRRYASELPQWLPATIHFTATSVRYLELAARDGGDVTTIRPPTLTMVDTPTLWDPNDVTPPPYPELAWLWDQLDR